MFSKNWKTSERKYTVVVERHVKIRMDDNVELDCDVFRPDSPTGKFPALLCVHAYSNELQTAPIFPASMFAPARGSLEAGDPEFFVRRGYVHIVGNVRGTGSSDGKYQHYGPREVKDTAEMIEWAGRQRWCDGNVGMFGVSYFAIAQLQVAALNPPSLKTIFAPFGYTDPYRHKWYHGGILNHGMCYPWATQGLANMRAESWTRDKLGDAEFKKAVEKASADRDIVAVPGFNDALRHPEDSRNAIVLDGVLNPCDGEYWQERCPKLENIKIPAYLGVDGSMIQLHTPGAFHAWEKVKGFKKMVIGPPIYFDRPLYQPMYEALRWFDHWLKDMRTGIEDWPDVRLFMQNSGGDWKMAGEWPLPETLWTPFYLHSGGLLSEHEFWPMEGHSTFEDGLYARGSLVFLSPPLVENTEVVGPILLKLYASTTADEVLWFVSLLDVGPGGEEDLLTRGWLRGSHREIDSANSKPFQVLHPHTKRELLTPNTVYEFDINLIETVNLFRAGHRMGLRIKCADDEKPSHPNKAAIQGHIWRQSTSRVTVYHNAENPSCLLLPVTTGNIEGTYLSGGTAPVDARLYPYYGAP